MESGIRIRQLIEIGLPKDRAKGFVAEEPKEIRVVYYLRIRLA